MKKDYKLYNLIFPTYILLYLSLPALAISIVGNFIIDSVLIIIISLLIYRKVDKKFYLHSVFVAFFIGFISDFFCALLCLFFDFRVSGQYEMQRYVVYGVIFSAFLIFIFNYFITFSRFGFNKTQQVLSALSFAVITAPYTFFLPNDIFY